VLPSDRKQLFLIPRMPGQVSREQHLSDQRRVQLMRFEPSESEAELGIGGHVEVQERLARLDPEEGLTGDRGISVHRSVRRLLEEVHGDEVGVSAGGRDAVGGRGASGTSARAIAGLDQRRGVELQPVEADGRILRVVEALLGLEFLLDVGVTEHGGHPEVRLDVAEGGVTVGLFEHVVLDRSVDVDRRRLQRVERLPAAGDTSVGRVGGAVEAVVGAVGADLREAVHVGDEVRLTVEVLTDGEECTHGHVGGGHAGVHQLEGCEFAAVEDLDVFLGEGHADLEGLGDDLEALLDLALGAVEGLALLVAASDEIAVDEVLLDQGTAIPILTQVQLEIREERIILENVVNELRIVPDVASGA